jgi:histidinol-phosphate aminotransferase
VIFLISPNNPTGTWIPREDVERVVAECNSLVVLDQAYIQYGPDGMLDLLDKYPNIVYFRTFSKALQLAGARLGFCIGRPEVINEFNKVLLPFNFDRFSLTVTRIALNNPEPFEQAVAESISERDRVYAAMKSYPQLEVFPSAANFIFFAAPPEARLFDAFLREGILIRPFGHLLDERDWLRVSIGQAHENDLFLEHLAKML